MKRRVPDTFVLISYMNDEFMKVKNVTNNRVTIPTHYHEWLRDEQKPVELDATLLCGHCRYNGPVEATSYDDIKRTKKNLSFHLNYQCPTCQSPATQCRTLDNNAWIDRVHSNTSTAEPDENLSFTFQFVKMYGRDEKIRIFHEPFRLSFNRKTGLLYFLDLKKKSIRTILWNGATSNREARIFNNLLSSLKVRNSLDSFFQQCLLSRSVTFENVASLKNIGNGEYYETFFNRYGNVLLYLRYPFLQDVPSHNWGKFPRYLRNQFTGYTGGAKSFYRLIFPRFSKSHIKRPAFLWSSLSIFDTLLKDTSVYHRFIQRVIDWEKAYPDQSKAFTGRIFNDYDENWRRVLRWFHRHCGNDQLFLKRILHICPFNNEEAQSQWQYELYTYLNDSYNMLLELKKDKASYSAPNTTEIHRLHTLLIKDYTRLTHQNVTISYKKKEREWETKHDDYRFSLAKDTHELVYHGSAMELCVGSYREQALSKTSIIAWMTRPSCEWPDCCLEIQSPSSAPALVQAMQADNKYPTWEQCQVIRAWCEHHGISWDTCYEVRKGLKREEATKKHA